MPRVAANQRLVDSLKANGAKQAEYTFTGIKHLALIVQPTGAASWYSSRRVNGRLLKKRLGNRSSMTLQDAKRAAIMESIKAPDPAPDPFLAFLVPTLNKVFDERLHFDTRLKSTTRTFYRTIYNLHIRNSLGETPVDQITRSAVIDCIDAVNILPDGSDSHRGRTADIVKSLVSATIRWGRRRGMHNAVNPVVDLERRAPSVSRSRSLSQVELQRLWQALNTREAPARYDVNIIIKLALLTLQRRAIITCALVSELDLVNGLWTIAGDDRRNGERVEGRMKSGRQHMVPLSPLAAELFASAVKTCSRGTPYVFASTQRVGEALDPHSVSTATRRIFRKLGIADARLHDLRRTAATYVRQQGASHDVVQAILDHKPQDVTGAVYLTAKPLDEMRKALDMWSDYLQSLK